jgi:hypothetical protein
MSGARRERRLRAGKMGIKNQQQQVLVLNLSGTAMGQSNLKIKVL